MIILTACSFSELSLKQAGNIRIVKDARKKGPRIWLRIRDTKLSEKSVVVNVIVVANGKMTLYYTGNATGMRNDPDALKLKDATKMSDAKLIKYAKNGDRAYVKRTNKFLITLFVKLS